MASRLLLSLIATCIQPSGCVGSFHSSCGGVFRTSFALLLAYLMCVFLRLFPESVYMIRSVIFRIVFPDVLFCQCIVPTSVLRLSYRFTRLGSSCCLVRIIRLRHPPLSLRQVFLLITLLFLRTNLAPRNFYYRFHLTSSCSCHRGDFPCVPLCI